MISLYSTLRPEHPRNIYFRMTYSIIEYRKNFQNMKCSFVVLVLVRRKIHGSTKLKRLGLKMIPERVDSRNIRHNLRLRIIEKDTSSYHDMIYKRISTSSDTPKRIANIKLNRASGSICDCCRSCVVM